MSANKEFPPFSNDVTDAGHKREVQDWFKRCIGEYEEIKPIIDDDVVDWFDKWFSQFRNNSDK